MEKIDNYKYEKELWKQGFNNIAGTDEVGRGPLIGPVVTSCVVLPHNFKLEGLTDSKKISEKKRNIFADYIKKNCIAYAVGIVSPEEIDEINIYEASRKAMLLALNKVRKEIKVDYVLTDAMPLDIDIPTLAIKKGDLKSVTIAAASVIAKVTRDEMMYELSKKYPMYGFDKHKGYPTKKHLEALKQYGLIDGYRKTYKPVKEILERSKENEFISE